MKENPKMLAKRFQLDLPSNFMNDDKEAGEATERQIRGNILFKVETQPGYDTRLNLIRRS